MPDAPVGELVDRVRWLEELGLDLAGVADHFVDSFVFAHAEE